MQEEPQMTQRFRTIGVLAAASLALMPVAFAQTSTPAREAATSVNPTPMPPGSVARDALGMGGGPASPLMRSPVATMPVGTMPGAVMPGFSAPNAAMPGTAGLAPVVPPVTLIDPRLVDLPDAAETARQRQAADRQRLEAVPAPGTPPGTQPATTGAVR